ncbi:MAG: c-type cytochrome [Flavobacteriaceae bacterium]
MRKKTILIVSTIALILISAIAAFMSFNQKSEANNYGSLAYVANIEKTSPNLNIVEDEGYTLMKANCYVCHNPKAASHDEIIAPPFKAVKMRYTRQYINKEEFVNAVVNWALEPSEDKALMYGAVNQFKVMPKLALDKSDLEKIASYLYDNDVEEPEWMGDHMKEEKNKGHGQGKGMGNGGMKCN